MRRPPPADAPTVTRIDDDRRQRTARTAAGGGMRRVSRIPHTVRPPAAHRCAHCWGRRTATGAQIAYSVPSRSIGIVDMPSASKRNTLRHSASFLTVLQPWNV